MCGKEDARFAATSALTFCLGRFGRPFGGSGLNAINRGMMAAVNTETAMSENKLLARRYFDQLLNAGNFSIAETLLASDFVFRNPPIVARGVNEFRAAIDAVRTGFPDLHFTIHDEIGEGDKVAVRWTVTGTQREDFIGHPPSGKTIDVTGTNVFRIAAGKIQEVWVNMDRLGEAEQLGWITPLIR